LTGAVGAGQVDNRVNKPDSPEIRALRAQLEALRHQQAQAAFDDNAKQLSAQGNTDAIAAQKRLSAFMSPADTRDNQIKKANADRLAALYGVVDPAERARISAQADKQIADANRAYESATKVGATGRGARAKAPLDFTGKDVELIRKEIEAEGKLMDQRRQNVQSIADYNAAADAQVEAVRRSIDSQVAKIGMGDKEYAQQQQINDILQKGADVVARYTAQRNRMLAANPNADTSVIDAQIATQQTVTDRIVSITAEGYHRMDAARADWTNGLNSALDDYLDRASDVAG
jgi:hypothetical protein